MVSSLEKIGIKVKPRELASSAAYTTIQTVKNKIPIALNAGWGKDYADAYTFGGPLFDSRFDHPDRQHQLPLQGMTSEQAKSLGSRSPRGHHPQRQRRHRRLPEDRPRPAGPAQPVLRRPRQEGHGDGAVQVPTCGPRTSPSPGHRDQVRVRPVLRLPSYTQMAVNNKETVPS